MNKPPMIVLWTGPKHSSKSSSAVRLIETAISQGLRVAGILAPSRYKDGNLTGFDIVNLQTNKKEVLSRVNADAFGARSFEFTQKGRQFGKEALDPERIKYCDFIVVDEFGPFEIKGRGWRKEIDLLLELSIAPLLIIVREELIKTIQALYRIPETNIIHSQNENSVNFALSILTANRPVMFSLDKMLLVGSDQRKTGKTTLVCELLRKFSERYSMVAIKITTLSGKGLNSAQKNSTGSNHCLKKNGYCITEENNFCNQGQNDTSRFLAAGAVRSFLIEAFEEHLLEGFATLLEAIGKDLVIICESTSLRKVVKPGLFIMMTSNIETSARKPFAEHLTKCADVIWPFEKAQLESYVNRITYISGKWNLIHV